MHYKILSKLNVNHNLFIIIVKQRNSYSKYFQQKKKSYSNSNIITLIAILTNQFFCSWHIPSDLFLISLIIKYLSTAKHFSKEKKTA